MLQALRDEHAHWREIMQALRLQVSVSREEASPVDRDALRGLLAQLPSVPDLLVKGRRRRLFALTRARCPPIGAVLDRCAQRLECMERLRERAAVQWRTDGGRSDGGSGEAPTALRLDALAEGVLGQLAVLDDYILPVALHYLVPEDWIELARMKDVCEPPGPNGEGLC